MVTASHNHNTPYYSTPGLGHVRSSRTSSTCASTTTWRSAWRTPSSRRERRHGARCAWAARRATFDAIQAHTYGPKVGDDGTPAGQPYDHTTRSSRSCASTTSRDPAQPKPLANWVVFGVHPEWTWGYDLINGDITHAAARMVDRELGDDRASVSQRETGTSGPHKDTRVHEPEARREFQDNGFAQLDRGARLLADAIKAARDDIAHGTPAAPRAPTSRSSRTSTSTRVSQRFAPPATRPYPGRLELQHRARSSTATRASRSSASRTASRRRTRSTERADAGDRRRCTTSSRRPASRSPSPTAPTTLTAVEETAAVHLMAMQARRHRARRSARASSSPTPRSTSRAASTGRRATSGHGLRLDRRRRRRPAATGACRPATGRGRAPTRADPSTDLAPISDVAYRRIRAQINNDARGWETDLATLGIEAEPADPAKIKGNFTHEEFTEHGYGLVLAVGMGNDYWGYVPEYREYRSHDHYRKALSGLGPHGADFLATRLVAPRRVAERRAGAGAPAARHRLPRRAGARRGDADGARRARRARTRGLQRDAAGRRGSAGDRSSSRRPSRASPPRTCRGSAARTTPTCRTCASSGWSAASGSPYATTDGDVQLMVEFPKPDELLAWRSGSFAWRWTASFEAFASDIEQPDARRQAARRRRGHVPLRRRR